MSENKQNVVTSCIPTAIQGKHSTALFLLYIFCPGRRHEAQTHANTKTHMRTALPCRPSHPVIAGKHLQA